MDTVRLRNPFGDLLAVSDWRATAAQRAAALPRRQASFRMRTWQVDALDGRTLAQLYALAFQHSIATPSGESAAVLRRRVEEAVDRGLLLLIARPRAPVTVPLDEAAIAAEVLGPGPERQDVEFDLEYFDGTPVSGVRYVLVDSGGAKEKGVFGAHGVVQRRDVAGTYSLAIEEIDRIVCSPDRVRAGETVTISMRTSGVDDGASLTVRIYRLHDEDPEHALATLAAIVQQGQAHATWKPEPSSRDERGVASFVAEASLEGGSVWRKSAPLEVELPAVVGAEWSQVHVAPGEDIDLVVQAAGVPRRGRGGHRALQARRGRRRREGLRRRLPSAAAPRGTRQPALRRHDAPGPRRGRLRQGHRPRLRRRAYGLLAAPVGDTASAAANVA